MINQEFDDDIPDESEEEILAAFEAGEKGTTAPKGDFSRVMAGRTIWFKSPIPGQFHAWKRHRESLVRRFEKIKVQAKKNPSLEVLRDLSELSEKFDIDTLELVESLMVNQDDIDFVATEMIGGRITISAIHQVLFGDPGPDDDQEPAPVKKAAPKKIGGKPAKRTANVTRVKK